MEYIVLDLDKATEDQLIATIDCNNRTSRLMNSEVQKLKKVAFAAKNKQKPAIPTIVEPNQQEKEVHTTIDEDFENEVEFYNSQLQELTLDNIDAEIIDSLPSRTHYQYERILMRLKLESYRAIKEIKDLLNEEGFSISDMEEFKEEIELEKNKIELIEHYLKPEQEEQLLPTKKENNLVFVPTTGGNIRVLEELDSIPTEYYERFYGLFESIKDGTFKNAKRLQHIDLAGLSEVKDFKVRVAFKRISKDTYAVISAFVKKSDNDKAYRSSLIKKHLDYQQVEDSLKSNLNNPEFMDIQKTYSEELFRKLSSTKDTPAIKVKVGDDK